MKVGSSDKDAGQPRPVYSRRTPSPQYQVLVDFYQRMHSDGYNQIQQGAVFKKEGQFASQIKDLFQRHGVKTCLDYGAGKASHYFDSVLITDKSSGTEFNGLKAYWGIEEVTTWEPGLDNDGPKGIYDGAICVDVLEHCYAADLPWILEEIFSLARKCVFLNVACYPAQALLPNGENLHISVRSAEWWSGAISVISAKYPSIDFAVCCTTGHALTKKQHEWIVTPKFPASIAGAPVLTTRWLEVPL